MSVSLENLGLLSPKFKFISPFIDYLYSVNFVQVGSEILLISKGEIFTLNHLG